jgi:hypothetical protein
MPAKIEIVRAVGVARIKLADGTSHLGFRGHSGFGTESYPFAELKRVKGESHSGAEHKQLAQQAIKRGQAILIPFRDEPAKHIWKARKRYGRMGWTFKTFKDNANRVVVVWRSK